MAEYDRVSNRSQWCIVPIGVHAYHPSRARRATHCRQAASSW
ncbi:hypothetical protein [Lawsonella clevelandensis]|nr:hypothetical protein [Lawsonella clevelandensis]